MLPKVRRVNMITPMVRKRPERSARAAEFGRYPSARIDSITRARVIESMRALGYRPNSAARALRSGRFRTIGVIMFTLRTFGNMRTLDAIASEAAHANYSVMLIPVVDATLEQVSGAYSRLSEQGVDGVIIVFE